MIYLHERGIDSAPRVLVFALGVTGTHDGTHLLTCCACSEELDKKIKISRGKVEESRARMKGSDEASALKQRSKAVRSAEHRLDVIMARINTIVRGQLLALMTT
jgi:hypothetical protein